MDIIDPLFAVRRKYRTGVISSLIAGTLVVVVIVLLRLSAPLPEVDRANLWIDTVRNGTMVRDVEATGVLVPREIRWIAAGTPAQVERILVWPGAHVQPDTILMQLSAPELEDNLQNAIAQVAAAKADLAAKQAELASQMLDTRSALARAKADYASAKVKTDADFKGYEIHVVAAVQYQSEKVALDQLQANIDVQAQRVAAFNLNMQAQLDAQRALLAQQENTLQLRQRQADALSVRAGIDGVLQEVPVQEGAQVTAGANLARVAQPSVLVARLQVPEVQAKDVVIGMPVTVDTHNGTVEGVIQRIDPAVHDGAVQVEVGFSGPLPAGVRPDLSVDGRILLAKLDNVLSVGRPALARPNAEIGIFRLDRASGIAQRVSVQLGAMSTDRVEILKGLAPGDQVILSDTSQWDNVNALRVK
jgi:HlyD family secretion protein